MNLCNGINKCFQAISQTHNQQNIMNTKREFQFGQNDKNLLALANEKGSICLNVGTELLLTGDFYIEDGIVNWRTGERINNHKKYAFFECKKNGKPLEHGLAASMLLRRPSAGWPSDAVLTSFQQGLDKCQDAQQLYDYLDNSGAFGGKAIVVKSHIRVEDIPYGCEEPRLLPFAIFDILGAQYLLV